MYELYWTDEEENGCYTCFASKETLIAFMRQNQPACITGTIVLRSTDHAMTYQELLGEEK